MNHTKQYEATIKDYERLCAEAYERKEAEKMLYSERLAKLHEAEEAYQNAMSVWFRVKDALTELREHGEAAHA